MEHLIIDNDLLFGNVVEKLRQGCQATIPVKGNSMLPFIQPSRDVVVLEGVEGASPDREGRKRVKKDDIVLFHYRDQYILHRIVSIDGDEATIQGDGNWRSQEKCRLDQIYGRVITIIRDKRTSIDPYSKKALRELRIWNMLQPLRRYILAIFIRTRRLFNLDTV